VLADLRQADVPRSLRRDLRDLVRFYLDDDQRARLAGMGRIRRFFLRLAWILRAMLLRLSPARRLAVVLALAFALLADTRFTYGTLVLRVDLRWWGFILLLVVLMLELKDKLLARDEIELARQVQLALLPREAPRLRGWEIWLYTRPANDVGGDLVDAIEVVPGRLGLVLGDVAGKGLAAALLASKLQATLRAVAADVPPLDELAARVNRIMTRDGIPNRFATLFQLDLAADGAGIRWVNAGHLPPFVVREGGVEQLPPGGLPFGIDAAAAYEEQVIDLGPDDLLLVFSDGLTEARRPDDAMFGEGPLQALAPRLAGLGAEAAGRRLVEEVDRFLVDRRVEDDLSLVILRRLAPGAADPT
jgi:sigma-B regulation protein RsbU (phosphoserine phosphatase)